MGSMLERVEVQVVVTSKGFVDLQKKMVEHYKFGWRATTMSSVLVDGAIFHTVIMERR